MIMLRQMLPKSPVSRVTLFNPLLFMNVKRAFSANTYEGVIANMLRSAEALKDPTAITVEDRSGGCGANFYILVESSAFKGMPRIKQHRLVQDILKDEIAKWHAVSIETRAPSS
jgi:stress-induced morphogen